MPNKVFYSIKNVLKYEKTTVCETIGKAYKKNQQSLLLCEDFFPCSYDTNFYIFSYYSLATLDVSQKVSKTVHRYTQFFIDL